MKEFWLQMLRVVQLCCNGVSVVSCGWKAGCDHSYYNHHQQLVNPRTIPIAQKKEYILPFSKLSFPYTSGLQCPPRARQ